jgi:hypothetical protein
MSNVHLIYEIQSFLDQYFEVLYTQNLELFDQVFHSESVLYSAQDGDVVVRPIAQYREIIKNRQSPLAGQFQRDDNIIHIDVMSPEMALVKVRLKLFDHVMEDYLNLLKINGKWQIVAKLFHRVS